jgi:hypothetical protein
MKKLLRPLVGCLLIVAILAFSDCSTYFSLRDSIFVLMATVTWKEPVLTSDEDLARKVAAAVVRLVCTLIEKHRWRGGGSCWSRRRLGY